jgi:hypothetical protein
VPLDGKTKGDSVVGNGHADERHVGDQLPIVGRVANSRRGRNEREARRLGSGQKVEAVDRLRGARVIVAHRGQRTDTVEVGRGDDAPTGGPEHFAQSLPTSVAEFRQIGHLGGVTGHRPVFIGDTGDRVCHGVDVRGGAVEVIGEAKEGAVLVKAITQEPQ